VGWISVYQDSASGRSLWTLRWTFGFHRGRRISWPTEQY